MHIFINFLHSPLYGEIYFTYLHVLHFRLYGGIYNPSDNENNKYTINNCITITLYKSL